MVRVTKGGPKSTAESLTTCNLTAKDLDKKIAEALKDIHNKVIFVAESKDVCDETLHNTTTVIDKIRADKKLSQSMRTKLKTCYASVLTDAQDEAEAIREALQAINAVRRLRSEKRMLMRKNAAGGPPLRRGALMVMLQQCANTLPLWVGELGDKPPALCGCIGESTDHQIHPGSSVAAMVNPSHEEHNWILAEVRSYSTVTSKYTVEDVDEEQEEKYNVARNRLISLPIWRANPTSDLSALFPENAIVLAMYPQTTCFYKGVIEQVPSSPQEDYLVAFEDSSFPGGYSPPMPVPQRYVVQTINTLKS